MVSGSHDTTVKLWDIGSGACLSTFTGHTGAVLAVCYSPDGRYVVSGSHDTTVKVWDIGSGACMSTFTGHTSNSNVTSLFGSVVGISCFAFSSDGLCFISGSSDCTVMSWSLL